MKYLFVLLLAFASLDLSAQNKGISVGSTKKEVIKTLGHEDDEQEEGELSVIVYHFTGNSMIFYFEHDICVAIRTLYYGKNNKNDLMDDLIWVSKSNHKKVVDEETGIDAYIIKSPGYKTAYHRFIIKRGYSDHWVYLYDEKTSAYIKLKNWKL